MKLKKKKPLGIVLAVILVSSLGVSAFAQTRPMPMPLGPPMLPFPPAGGCQIVTVIVDGVAQVITICR